LFDKWERMMLFQLRLTCPADVFAGLFILAPENAFF